MKKIIPVVLAFAMLLCFAACGETETESIPKLEAEEKKKDEEKKPEEQSRAS